MLDQQIKQAYQKIAPSSQLEHRILSMTPAVADRKGKVLNLKPIMTVAACLALLLGTITVTSYLQNSGDASILIQGSIEPKQQEVSILPEIVDYVMPAAPRTVSIPEEPAAHAEWQPGAAIDLQITSHKEVLLRVDEGILYVISDEEGTVTAAGQSLSVAGEKGMTTVRWVVPAVEQDAEYQLYAQDDVICVRYSAQSNEYTVSRTEADN